ncbi:PLP-dependent aminotransferase family protein [Salinicola corii]|uniref:PLP-dependent aminotransferase family protein n=1 Tax=Salinicola corii TaxID=2606937 RepID=A0A640WFF8_9GAMM|nr:PLP-dependent aminotransferase family protein [Salinicola corii]KAA0018852.1 PLP-dependent aminotransferase family protein [Salinicola corii]
MTIWIPVLPGQGPRYRELADAIATATASGELTAGAKLPPQRRLADALGVTVGTVTRAYALAEQRGVVTARVGSGTYVRDTGAPHPAFDHVRRAAPDSGIVDLSLSLPPPHPRREASLANAMRSIQHDPALLRAAIDYQPEAGQEWQREVISGWLATLGRAVPADELLINQGGMHGIFLSLSALLSPGERLAAERLTYPGLISGLQQLSLKSVAIAHDQEGIDIDALARAFEQQPFRALYLMPDCHNPTTARLSETRRHALVALARERQFWLIEDDIHPQLDDEPVTPLYRLAPECTVTLFSVAKLLGGGLRVGAMRAPPALQGRLTAALRAQSWMPPPLMASLVCRWIESGDADALLQWQREELEWRFDRAMERLGEFSPRGHRGGFYLWLPLPGELRTSHVVSQLQAQGVNVSTAESFCLGSVSAPQAIRVCISAAESREALEHALRIIATTLGDPDPMLWQTV